MARVTGTGLVRNPAPCARPVLSSARVRRRLEPGRDRGVKVPLLLPVQEDHASLLTANENIFAIGIN